ncbi:ABC transporter substrate-binding protein [Oribacterium sp. Sow4_G1_1]|uniref:ABC transporter substrate-binding protein n=1 Tax=Oribacterium sp. Sow4_G1_1 TaxID=3438794 RepID=UPI003F95AB96
MKKKRLISLLLAVVMTAAMLTGCGGQQQSTGSKKTEGKIQISMYLWDRSMLKELSPWLEEKFPEIEFTFIQSFNTIEYYKDLLSRGEEIPDIITCRRFSLNDAAPLAEHLMDLSSTEVAGTFYSSYLEVNRETNGAIRWLPMCAEVDCTMANKDLFDQYGIPLPTNYAEFVAAIDAFEAVGIKGYQTDWDYDYTCLETMQGCAIPELMSLEGTQWRMAYESETEEEPVGLDDVVWPKVFEKYEQFLKDVRFEQGDEELMFSKTMEPYYEGKTAMIRNTAALVTKSRMSGGSTASSFPISGRPARITGC